MVIVWKLYPHEFGLNCEFLITLKRVDETTAKRIKAAHHRMSWALETLGM